MCLSFLSKTPFEFKFLGEYIFLEQKDDQLQAREIYDVFLQPLCDWADARILCISPHDLIENGMLRVSAIETPGRGGYDDKVAYETGSGIKCSFDYASHSFTIKVLGGDDPSTLRSPEVYSGEIPQLSISVPQRLAQNSRILEAMSQAGTLFELSLGNLAANHDYAFRLQVTPHRLLGLGDKDYIKETTRDDPGAILMQALSIFCPKTCRLNFESLVEKAESHESYTDAAASILAFVKDRQLRLFEPARHRILLISPPNSIIEQSTPLACVWWVGVYPLRGSDHRRAYEWAGGTRSYWADHVESLARTIWEYLKEWAAAEPKTKEAITAALNVLHTNCSLVVDALASVGAVVLVDPQRGAYKVVGIEPPKEAFRAVAANISVRENFDWIGYEIKYAVRYEYINENDHRRIRWLKFKSQWTFWIAVASMLLTILGILVTRWWSK